MKLFKACIAMAAFAAIFVVPSVASAGATLTHPTGISALGWTEAGSGKGLKVQATNVAHAQTSKITKMALPTGGAVECETATLTGELAKNKEGEVWGDITTAEFRGRPSQPEPEKHGIHCDSPFGKVTVTPSHTVNPVHNGVASLPWCIEAGNEDVFVVTGGACHQPERPLTFTLDTPIGECEYWKQGVIGTYTTHPNAALLTIKDQEFKKTTGSAFCPASGKLTMAFTLEDDTGGTPKDVYIDKV
jgi:hypothetical protein